MVDQTLVEFVKALRAAEVRVSPAETLDAMGALDIVGYNDREFLKNSLSLVLSKNTDEKEAFDICFDRFFTFDKFNQREQADDFSGEDGSSLDDRKGDFEPRSGNQSGSGQGGGGQGSGQAKEEEEEDLSLEPSSPLGQLLLSRDKNALMVAMINAGREVKVREIVVFTQKGLFTRKIMDHMGLRELQDEISELQESGTRPETALASRLKRARDRLREMVRDYVEKQFILHADEKGKQLREELLKKVKLSNLEKRNLKDVQEIVFKMAKKLISVHSKRKKTYKRGALDVRKTLRNNMQYDGNLFDIRWKASKVDRPKVMAICDVSGSVSNYSRFLLMFLYSLTEILPQVRAFAFSSDLGEVTKLFENSDLETAMARTLRDYGNGSTDYGQMLTDFRNHCLNDVNNKTTIIILGDARNNYGNPKAEILKEMYNKSKRVIWLNPEPRSSWSVGDNEMRKYAPCCHQAEVCNSLVHLERVVSNLLRTVA